MKKIWLDDVLAWSIATALERLRQPTTNSVKAVGVAAGMRIELNTFLILTTTTKIVTTCRSTN
jgi:uncharacterized membrane protein